VPVLIGTSNGELAFIGVRQVASVVGSIRDEYNFPIFLNADHHAFDSRGPGAPPAEPCPQYTVRS
jgi:fructose-bisphosphate aldolase class II